MNLEVSFNFIDTCTKLLDLYSSEKEYEKRIFMLYSIALEHESFDEHDRLQRADWFFFVQILIALCEGVISLKEQILNLEAIHLEKIEKNLS